jgi:hypothetical protein
LNVSAVWILGRIDNDDQRETRRGLSDMVWVRKTPTIGESDPDNTPDHASDCGSRDILR